MKKLLLIISLVLPFTFGIANNHRLNIIQEESNDSVYSTVDQKPYLKHHRNNLEKMVLKSTVYPSLEKLKGVEGVVLVNCVVDINGKVSSCQVEKRVSPALDEEAIKVVFKLGPWVPAKLNGKDVASYLTVPVRFSLTDDEREVVKALQPIDFEKKPPLFILDGKIIDGIVNVEPYDVRTVRVIKGNKAVGRYGDKAKYGVVEITTKRGTPPLK